jgi:HemY protein
MRAVAALVAIGILVAAAVFLTSNPGRVDIVWQGWQVETSVGVLVAVAVLAALAVALVLWLLSLILGSPRAFLRRRRERRRRAGYRALTRGMVAVAAGDPQEAQRHARKADMLLAEPPLTLLLSAQAAQIGGDETAAKRFFTLMLDRPETRFLGLRGLFNQAMRENDRGTARRLAERAVALRPNTGWAVLSLFDLEARGSQWQAARDTLEQAVKRRVIAPEPARHHQGVLDYELSRLALSQGDRRRAMVLAARARTLALELATPAAYRARLLLQEGRTRRAARTLERAWRTAPHPELAQVYREIWNAETPLARMARFERLAAQNPGIRESHLTSAEAALTAQLWGEARRYLELALIADPVPSDQSPAIPAAPDPSPAVDVPGGGRARATTRLCLMMARLEEAEHGNLARAREWLDQAARAVPDPRYVCASCGGESLEWSSLCPRCGAFDALAWRTPAWGVHSAALPGPVDNPAATDLALARPPELPTVNPASG